MSRYSRPSDNEMRAFFHCVALSQYLGISRLCHIFLLLAAFFADKQDGVTFLG